MRWCHVRYRDSPVVSHSQPPDCLTLLFYVLWRFCLVTRVWCVAYVWRMGPEMMGCCCQVNFHYCTCLCSVDVPLGVDIRCFAPELPLPYGYGDLAWCLPEMSLDNSKMLWLPSSKDVTHSFMGSTVVCTARTSNVRILRVWTMTVDFDLACQDLRSRSVVTLHFGWVMDYSIHAHVPRS